MRTEARIKCSIWSDPDYVALPVEAKLLYQFLLEQDDLGLCGVIALREVRWEGPLGIAAPSAFLEILEKARFVVIDYDEQELWIRTFMRWDGVLTSPKVLIGARLSLATVRSQRIRRSMAAEYPELAQEWGLDTLPDTPSDTPSDTRLARVRRTEVGGRRTEVGGNAQTVDLSAGRYIAPLWEGSLEPDLGGSEKFGPGPQLEDSPAPPLRGFYPRDLLRFPRPAAAGNSA